VLQVAGADVVDVAMMEDTGDDKAGVSGTGDGVSTTELDSVSWTGVGSGSEAATGSSDDDALITGATVEEMVSVSVSIGIAWDSVDVGMSVVVGSADVRSAVVDATEETTSTCKEATSDVASGAVAVLESSAVMIGDSVRVAKTLEELVIASVEAVTSDVASEAGGWPGPETGSVAAVDSEAASSEDVLSIAVVDALALVMKVIGYRLSTDAIVDEEDGIGSASDALVT